MACMSLAVTAIQAQHYVPVAAANKNVIYEEFTGVRCVNCPSGHTTLAQILAANPDRAFAVAYHPFNSSYTQPYAGDPDFRRHYADSLYMTPYCGTSRYMPSAFVHRRVWSAPERLTERTNWTAYGSIIMGEPSPLNVGMATSYDQATKILTVVVDVYYTADVSGSHNLMLTLAENNLQSQQSGASGTYTHKHTFRESLVGQWGDLLSDNASAGTFYTKQFTFDNAAAGYNMENCELTAFVIDNNSSELVSGIGCAAGDTTFITPDVSLSLDTLYFTTPAQCSQGLTASIKNNSAVPVILTDVQPASAVPQQVVWNVDPWPFTSFPYTLNPGDSVNLTIHVILPLDHSLTGFFLDSLYVTSEIETHYLMIAVNQDLYTSAGGEFTGARRAAIYNCHPNPFSDATTMEYFLPERTGATIEVFNLSGLSVKVLNSGTMDAGKHWVTWDGTDGTDRPVPGGIYLVRLSTGEGSLVRRVALLPGER